MANLDRTGTPVYSNEIRKLEVTDPAHADLFNPIHAQLLENEEYLKQELGQGDSGTRVTAFEEAVTRENLVSGETHRTLFGKIKKFFADLKPVAFTGKYTDLTGIPAAATGSAAGLMSAADKAKLDGVEAQANRYVHPASHAATMITQDATHRFVTDTEKANWNAKAGTAVATTTANGLMAAADKTKLNGIAAGANAYVHPSTHPASMITGLPTSLPANGGNAATVAGLTPDGILTKGGRHLAGQGSGGGYSFVGDGAYDTGLFSDADGDLYLKRNGAKITLPANGTIPNTATKMPNAAYADSAGAVAWNNVSGKPGTYPPSGHTHDDRYYTEAETNNLLNGKAASSHSHPAGQVTAGTLPAGVKATNGTDYGTSRLRNVRFGTAAPSSLANGEIFFVYE